MFLRGLTVKIHIEVLNIDLGSKNYEEENLGRPLEVAYFPGRGQCQKYQKIVSQLPGDQEVLFDMLISILAQPVGIFLIGQ